MSLTRIDLAITGVALTVVVLSYLFYRRRQLNGIRGPKAVSYLFGVEHQLKLEEYAGQLTSKWAEEYGTTYKIPGCFGVCAIQFVVGSSMLTLPFMQEKILVTSDPRAVHHILHEHVVDYPATREIRRLFGLVAGKSVVTALGDDHKRHRRVLSPAFSINHMKSFAPLFQHRIAELTARWNAQVEQGTEVWDIVPWILRTTLDIIGESSFNYNFQALEDKPNKLTQALRELENSSLGPSPLQTLKAVIPRYLPPSIPIQAKCFLTRAEQAAVKYFEAVSEKAKDMMRQSGLALDVSVMEKELTGKEKDVLSTKLVRANRAEDPQKQLTEYEVLSQIALLIQAGHHTTGYSLAWVLYELARHPADQRRVYHEIQCVRARASGEFTAGDYDDLGNGWLGFCVKEALRLHPILIHLNREAKSSDVVPLEYPIESSTGAAIVVEVPVQAGQRVVVDIATYNRLTSIWGTDANEWNPARFSNPMTQSVTVGMTANILTFSGGPKGCMGWRFALMELHALVAGLIEQFDFSLPEDLKIKALSMTLTLPVVVGQEEAGPMLPMVIQPRAV
ncbi:hypothetical protein VNI00_014178 [Paramarasmius palmivorus]|uniref:Cytochrome P450 n=1 Tax=Paramarasmius palmivorus TaxID=297713 RepID=A0AAW0BYQ3_9AGAR